MVYLSVSNQPPLSAKPESVMTFAPLWGGISIKRSKGIESPSMECTIFALGSTLSTLKKVILLMFLSSSQGVTMSDTDGIEKQRGNGLT